MKPLDLQVEYCSFPKIKGFTFPKFCCYLRLSGVGQCPIQMHIATVYINKLPGGMA